MTGVFVDHDLPQKQKPQPGPQTLFACTPAKISIFGGQAGGGKTNGIVSNAARFVDHPQYSATLFRRERTQIYQPGGLWAEASRQYPLLGAEGIRYRHVFRFPSGSEITFQHMEHEDDRFNHDGAEITYIGFDEVQNFTSNQFWYLFSRNRTTTGLPCFVRATCNPKPDTWLSRLLQWWWDPETGYPIRRRSGLVKWLVNVDDQIYWGDSKRSLIARLAPDFVNNPDNPKNPIMPVSFTFIMSSIEDNQILLKGRGIEYLSSIRILPAVEQERLLKGNWKIVARDGDYFPISKIEFVDRAPEGGQSCRGWDQAATKPTSSNPDPDYTAGVKITKKDNIFFVCDSKRFREEPNAVNSSIRNTAEMDGGGCGVAMFKDPGAAGKQLATSQTQMLSGFIITVIPATKSKVTLALPFSSQWHAGNVKIVRGPWNSAYLNELNSFESGGRYDDQVDASSAAFQALTNVVTGDLGFNL